MATHNVTDARSSVNGHSAVPNADGSVTVVISRVTIRGATWPSGGFSPTRSPPDRRCGW